MKPITKSIIWSKADANRAAKMGWELILHETRTGWAFKIYRHGTRFKSDAEAARWVVSKFGTGDDWDSKGTYCETIRKAVLLCCGGGR